jgi:FAD/FMN-containing dehydrogenase
LKEVEELLTFDAAVLALAIDHGYRRYVQSEIPAGPRFYRRYFGDELYKALWRRKRAQDPQNILNRGWVFDGSLQPDECTTSVHGEPASQR